ncbi:hypothetical protein [Arcobacter sp.]|uniref:hypothetical protein n=1 Tax=Arcobacter sp. TaxID=1872629 RepID=UPI003D09779E
MNRINPLYIFALIIFLLFISFIALSAKKSELKNRQNIFTEKIVIAKDFQILKSNYQNKSTLLSKINALKYDALFKNENIEIKDKEKHISVLIKSDKKDILNKFLNRILHERFLITKLVIESDMISFEMEK